MGTADHLVGLCQTLVVSCENMKVLYDLLPLRVFYVLRMRSVKRRRNPTDCIS